MSGPSTWQPITPSQISRSSQGGRKFILQKLLLFHTDLRTSFRLLSTILSISLSSPSMGDCHLVPFHAILPGLLFNKDLLGPFIFLAAGFLILFLKVSMKHVWLPPSLNNITVK